MIDKEYIKTRARQCIIKGFTAKELCEMYPPKVGKLILAEIEKQRRER